MTSDCLNPLRLGFANDLMSPGADERQSGGEEEEEVDDERQELSAFVYFASQFVH